VCCVCVCFYPFNPAIQSQFNVAPISLGPLKPDGLPPKLQKRRLEVHSVGNISGNEGKREPVVVADWRNRL
jgi:hypothetical protein